MNTHRTVSSPGFLETARPVPLLLLVPVGALARPGFNPKGGDDGDVCCFWDASPVAIFSPN